MILSQMEVMLLVILAVMGFSTFVIGLVYLGGCGNALLLPVVLAVNGALWVFPFLVFLFLNLCSPREEDFKCLHVFLHAFFLLCLVFLFACTIYTLVTASQIKSLDFLCSQTWLPPYMLTILIANWLAVIVFLRLFCVHQIPPEKPPPTEFRHLKNLPPLIMSWNRHRVVRTY
ncbi:hypothetical protein ACOMHN_043130 [Nucella lapillus]